MKTVAIIGAGITGLSAAYRLRQSQVPVTVYEAGGRVGGVIRTLRQEGYLAEYGPNTLLETSPKITELVRELGLAGRRLDSDPRAKNRYIVRGQKPVNLPDSALLFLATKLFSASAKLRLLLEPFIGRANHEESVAEFVKRRLGQEFLDYAIDPLVSGIYSGDPFRLSIQHAFPKVYELERKYGSLIKGQILGAPERKRRQEVSKAHAKKFSFDEGLQVLPDTLHARLGNAVRLNAVVVGVTQNQEGWTVKFSSGGGLEQEEHAAVLFAGPAYQLPRIQWDTQLPLDMGPFAEIHYPPVASVVLGFRREHVAHPLDGFGMLIPGVEGFGILGAVFSSSLFPDRAPAGHVTLTAYVGGARHPELALQSEEAMVQLTLKDLRTLLGVNGPPTFQHIAVFKKAIPQYEVGFGRFKELMDKVEEKAPGLFLAGHFRHGISLSDSLLSGLQTAEKIEKYFNRLNLNQPAPLFPDTASPTA
ncbi:MAG: protoporphyrinogen oxidase [Verrucomicrobiota bacterium]